MASTRRRSRRARTRILALAPAVLLGCWAFSGVNDLRIIDPLSDAGEISSEDGASEATTDGARADAALDGADGSDGAADAAPAPALGGVAHFLQPGQILNAVLRVNGYADETLPLTSNGAFAFASRYPVGVGYTLTLDDANCWARNASGTIPLNGASALDVRCRIIGQSLSTGAPPDTASDTFVAMPNLAPRSFSTDIPGDALITLTVPRCGFEPNPINGFGVVGIEIDGVVTDEAVHQAAGSGYHASLNIVTVRRLAPGSHTIRVVWRRELTTVNPPTSFRAPETSQRAGTLKKTFTVTMLDSLRTFLGATTQQIGTPLSAQTTADSPQTIAGLSTSVAGDAIVLAGVHFPDVSIYDGTQSRGVARLHVAGVVAATHSFFLPTGDHRRSASLLYAERYDPGIISIEALWNKSYGNTANAFFNLRRGAPRVFAARFDKSVPFAPTEVVTGDVNAVGVLEPKDVFAFSFVGYSARAVKALIIANVNRAWAEQASDGGELTLRAGSSTVAQAFVQTNGDGEGQGALLVGIADLLAGSTVMSLRLEAFDYPQLMHVNHDFASQPRSTMQVVPLD